MREDADERKENHTRAAEKKQSLRASIICPQLPVVHNPSPPALSLSLYLSISTCKRSVCSFLDLLMAARHDSA